MACHGLTYSFGQHMAVDDIDLEVAQAAIYGLLGPNGAGKTTTIRVLNTLLPTSPASAEVFGVDVARQPFTIRRLMGYMPQQLSADAGLTGRENLMLFARLFDIPRRQRKELVDESLEAMGVADAAHRMVSTYSGGMVRRLELAQALVNSPRLLVLDEPTIGLDPIGRSGVWERVQDLRNRTGMTVLLTTHYMDEADQLCDRVALMHHGQIRAEGTPAELKAQLGPHASLEDVFRHHAQEGLDPDEGGGFSEVRTARRTAGRLS
ncbi:MAG TPA: ATP-binding cassette domain-containing protein [Acidimicrobiales bacterium]